MRLIILIALMVSVTVLRAQTFMPASAMGNPYRGSFYNNVHLNDSTSEKKWSFSRYSAISSSFSLFKGGSATILSVPIGLQLNRRLNNNLYAFAGVSLAPAYVNFRQSFISNDFNKTGQNNTFFKSGNLGMYSRAELGLQYVNDEKTFSISGSIGIERSSYPTFQYAPINNARTKQIITTNR